MNGILVWNQDRPDVALENGQLYGGLHCGDCFWCYQGEWRSVRLEYLDGWILFCDGETMAVPYGNAVKL